MAFVGHKYNPQVMPAAELRQTFAARDGTLETLVEGLREPVGDGARGCLVTGNRGAGKTMLLAMLCLRLSEDAALAAEWLPLRFPEEVPGVTSLADLLSLALDLLKTDGVEGAAEALARTAAEPLADRREEIALGALEEISRRGGKKLLLLIENFDALLERALDRDARERLRRVLTTAPFAVVFGTAVRVFDERGDGTLQGYFRHVPLEKLTESQVHELLRKRAAYDRNELFAAGSERLRVKANLICHLAGGNPRLVVMLYDVLSSLGEQELLPVVESLRRLIDELTPFFAGVVAKLTPQQGKILDALMRAGGTARPAVLSNATGLSLNMVTAQLRRLKEARVVEVRGGGKGNPANYSVPDQLFSAWYKMRYVRPQHSRIEMLVEVLNVWFEAEELFESLKTLALRGGDAVTAEYLAAALVGTEYEQSARRLAAQAGASFESVDDDGDRRSSGRRATDSLRVRRGSELDELWDEIERGIRYGVAGSFDQAHACFDAVVRRHRSESGSPGGELIATARLYRGVASAKLEDEEAALADWRRVVRLPEAPRPHVQRALANIATTLLRRGVRRQQRGELKAARQDYSAVAGLSGAPAERAAMALFNRGVLAQKLGEVDAAVRDFTTVIQSPRTACRQVAGALVNRGVAKQALGRTREAIEDYTAVLGLKGAPSASVTMARYNRGVAHRHLGATGRALADYTAVIDFKGASTRQRALALFNRGLLRQKTDDLTGALADYTAVLELAKTPKAQLVKSRLNRGVVYEALGRLQPAIDDYTAVLGFKEIAPGERATALFNRGVARQKLGRTLAAVADYTAVTALAAAPPARVAMALFNRGLARQELGELAAAIDDYTTVVNAPEAPLQHVARAVLNRGVARESCGEPSRARQDYGAVVEMRQAPAETIAMAHYNRGVLRERLGEVEHALEDYTAVVELEGAPVEEVARALLNRGVVKQKLGDAPGSVADCTRVLELPGTPPERAAKALLNRGLARAGLGAAEEAIEDFTTARELAGEPEDAAAIDSHIIAATGQGLAQALQNRDDGRVAAILSRFTGVLQSQPKDRAVFALLWQLAAPQTRRLWPQAWRALSGIEDEEIQEKLEVFRPVVRVLEEDNRTVLDELPPEERSFVERVIGLFEAA